MYFLRILAVLILSSILPLLYAYAGDSRRPPTFPCISCGAPYAGTFEQPGTNKPICQDCFIKDYGQPTWSDQLGKWIPKPPNGGTFGSAGCTGNCHS